MDLLCFSCQIKRPNPKMFDLNRDSGKVIVVKTVTLGRLMELTKLPRIDVLKMDIEGSELTVIRECFSLLSVGAVDRLVMKCMEAQKN